MRRVDKTHFEGTCHRLGSLTGWTRSRPRENRGAQFAEAHTLLPLGSPGKVQDLQGPSYIFDLLTDLRIGA